MEVQWLDKMTTLPGFNLLPTWGVIALVLSIIQVRAQLLQIACNVYGCDLTTLMCTRLE